MTPCPADLSAPAIADWNATAPNERVLDVAWLFAQGDSPQQDVRLTIGSGRLLDIRPVPDAGCRSILPVAVVPPLVNPHVHLEFSGLTQAVTPAVPFTDWIREVIRWRRDHLDQVGDAIQSGLTECRACGVSVLGEITTSDGAVDLLRASGQKVISFRELIGILPDAIPGQLELLHSHIRRLPSVGDGTVTAGVNPHAPYSVHPDLLDTTAATCRDHGLPIAMHIAETRDELELLDRGTGEFARFLQEMDLWDANVFTRGRRPIFYLEQLAKVPHSLAVHCNYLTDDEIQFLGRHPEIAVVYCPRTHAYFGHDGHPWTKIMAAGGTVVLGTDGRSSNPDLSIWQEMQFAGRLTKTLSISDLIPLVTITAHRSLGLDSDDVCLQAGTPLNATLIQIDPSVPSPDYFLHPRTRPVAVICGVEGVTVMTRL